MRYLINQIQIFLLDLFKVQLVVILNGLLFKQMFRISIDELDVFFRCFIPDKSQRLKAGNDDGGIVLSVEHDLIVGIIQQDFKIVGFVYDKAGLFFFE